MWWLTGWCSYPQPDHITSGKRDAGTRRAASLAVKTEWKLNTEASETFIKLQCITSHVTQAAFQSCLSYTGDYLCHFMMGVCSHDLLLCGGSLWQGKGKIKWLKGIFSIYFFVSNYTLQDVSWKCDITSLSWSKAERNYFAGHLLGIQGLIRISELEFV